MTEKTMVNSPSTCISQGHFNEFEKHTRGIDSKDMMDKGYAIEGNAS
jgi:hypothetical protein